MSIYRCSAFGKQVGGMLTAREVVSLVGRIQTHAACGLACPTELLVERLEPDGWKVERVIDEWEPARILEPDRV